MPDGGDPDHLAQPETIKKSSKGHDRGASPRCQVLQPSQKEVNLS